MLLTVQAPGEVLVVTAADRGATLRPDAMWVTRRCDEAGRLTLPTELRSSFGENVDLMELVPLHQSFLVVLANPAGG